ncbi:b(0,+)-type amino acid transporter 1-like [Tenrec ecaudatus]|uniref:b(0,+)-type amino acid transporter 1-like n=1 Tax=Tenrec ecaudatus TaxID=94439 RepID=UPI003F59917B
MSPLGRNLVWALMIAIPLVTCLYILVNISYLLVLSPSEILSSDAVAVSWGLTAWIIYGTSISCLLYLRVKEKHLPRPYKVHFRMVIELLHSQGPRAKYMPVLCSLQVPTVIPVIMFLASVFLVLVPIIDHPEMEFFYLFLFLLSGFLVYFLFIYFHCQPKCLQMATLHLQLLMEVAPTMRNAHGRTESALH